MRHDSPPRFWCAVFGVQQSVKPPLYISMQAECCILGVKGGGGLERQRVSEERKEGLGWRPISPDTSLAYGLRLFGKITPLRAAYPPLPRDIHWQALEKLGAGVSRFFLNFF